MSKIQLAVSFFFVAFCVEVQAADEKTIGGQVETISKTSIRFAYLARDGRTLRATFQLNEKTEFIKDGKPVERTEVRPGMIVQITYRGRTVTQIKLPDTPRIAANPETDEEVLVDGEVAAVDRGAESLTIEKTNGKSITVKLDRNTEVRLDGNRSDLQALKKGQTVRVGVLKKARSTTRIFIYEVTDRPLLRP